MVDWLISGIWDIVSWERYYGSDYDYVIKKVTGDI